MKFFSLFNVFFIQICFAFCKIWAHSHGGHAHEEHEEEFQWNIEKSEFANIELETVGPGLIRNLVQVSGKVSVHPDRIAYVFPKINGAVCRISKCLGDFVEKGEVLAVIESREIASAKADYIRALKKLKLQEIILSHESVLKGVSAGEDYLKAELAKEEAFIDFEFTAQNLYALGLNADLIKDIEKEDLSSRRFYEIKAPIKGKVLQRNVTLGEFIENANKAFIVVDFEKVWVELYVSQNDVQHLEVGQPVRIFTSEGKESDVEVCHFNPAISEETRMATVIAVMENLSYEWKAGEFVSADIQTGSKTCPLVVAKEAIQTIKGKPYVFVENNGNFTPCIVKLGEMDDRNVEILSGLSLGDSYASSNAFCLKADYSKESAEHCHSH